MVAWGFAAPNLDEPNLFGSGSELTKNCRPLLSSTTLAICAFAGCGHKISVAIHKHAGMVRRLMFVVADPGIGPFYRAFAQHRRVFQQLGEPTIFVYVSLRTHSSELAGL